MRREVLLIAGATGGVAAILVLLDCSRTSTPSGLPSVLRSEPDLLVTFLRSRSDRDRLTRSWKLQRGVSLTGGDIKGYSPVGYNVDLETCRTICDSVVLCASVTWDCTQTCHLKDKTAGVKPGDVHAACTWSLSKTESTDVAADEETLRRRGMDGMVEPVRVLAGIMVVIFRCRENMPWLNVMLQSIRSALGLEVQVVIYERCVEPGLSSEVIQGFPVWRHAAPLIFTSTLCMIAHLLANFQAYVDGSVAHMVFVDAGLDARDAWRQQDASSWVRWDLGSFADTLMHVARLSGVHLVEARDSAEALVHLRDKLRDVGTKLLTWQRPAQVQTPGFSRCSALDRKVRSPPQVKNGSRRAVVTFLGDPDDIPAIRVLIASLMRVGCKSDLVLGAVPDMVLEAQELWIEFPHIRVMEWGRIQAPVGAVPSITEVHDYSKLNTLLMVKYDLLLYLDPGVFAIRNPDLVFLDRAARASLLPVLGAPDWGAWHGPPSDQMDEGVLLIRPSRDVYTCAVDALRSSHAASREQAHAGLGFLHAFFGGRATILPQWFNVRESSKRLYPHIWDEGRVVLLHLVRPHRTWSPPEFLRNFREPALRARLRASGGAEDEEEGSAAVAAPWRRMFFEMAKFTELLSLIALYHDRESYEALDSRIRARREVCQEPDVVVPLSLTEPLAPNGLATRQALPEVAEKSTQESLSEFAGLLAMSKASWYKKPWIGFTTGAEDRKSVWREGVSVDWVKVDHQVLRYGPEARKVAFWFGIFAGDYWALMEHHHPGMESVIKKVLQKMGENADHLAMPRNSFWPFGNYIMMPYALLREYAFFAQRYIDTFRGQFLFCPFKTMEEHTQHWASRCVGYTTERLIHIWSVMKGVSLEFVVDDPESRYLAGCKAHQVHCKLP